MDKKTATVSFGTESFTVPFETENDLFLAVGKASSKALPGDQIAIVCGKSRPRCRFWKDSIRKHG